MQRILLETWTTGIHLVLTTVRTSIPEVLRSHLHNRILALRPGNSCGDHTIATAFSEADREVTGRLAEPAVGAWSRHPGVRVWRSPKFLLHIQRLSKEAREGPVSDSIRCGALCSRASCVVCRAGIRRPYVVSEAANDHRNSTTKIGYDLDKHTDARASAAATPYSAPLSTPMTTRSVRLTTST